MMKFCSSLATIALFLTSSLAAASGEGPYLGVNGIYGTIQTGDVTVDGTTYTPTSNQSFGGGFSLGYNASSHFAFDAAVDGFNVIDFNGDNSPQQSYWFSYVAAKPMINFWKCNAFISVGAAYVYVSQDNPYGEAETNHSMVRPYGGAGFGINFTPDTELALSINRIEDTNTPITFGMLTLTYHFTQHYEDSGFLAD